jgi:hypothetical protein
MYRIYIAHHIQGEDEEESFKERTEIVILWRHQANLFYERAAFQQGERKILVNEHAQLSGRMCRKAPFVNIEG